MDGQVSENIRNNFSVLMYQQLGHVALFQGKFSDPVIGQRISIIIDVNI